jgi:DNA-binding protein Fis
VELLPEAGFQNDDPALSGIEPGLTLRELERTLLEKTLDATGGNRTRAAGMLGVSLRTVRNKIREFGLPPRRTA